MEKEDINKLSGRLKKGDQAAIAKKAGISGAHVSRFFNGEEDKVSEDNVTKILKAAAFVFKKREQKEQRLAAKNKAILKSI